MNNIFKGIRREIVHVAYVEITHLKGFPSVFISGTKINLFKLRCMLKATRKQQI